MLTVRSIRTWLAQFLGVEEHKMFARDAAPPPVLPPSAAAVAVVFAASNAAAVSAARTAVPVVSAGAGGGGGGGAVKIIPKYAPTVQEEKKGNTDEASARAHRERQKFLAQYGHILHSLMPSMLTFSVI